MGFEEDHPLAEFTECADGASAFPQRALGNTKMLGHVFRRRIGWQETCAHHRLRLDHVSLDLQRGRFSDPIQVDDVRIIEVTLCQFGNAGKRDDFRAAVPKIHFF